MLLQAPCGQNACCSKGVLINHLIIFPGGIKVNFFNSDSLKAFKALAAWFARQADGPLKKRGRQSVCAAVGRPGRDTGLSRPV
mgnify:CR=1 FL=1